MSMVSKSYPERVPIRITNSQSIKYLEVNYSEIKYKNFKDDIEEALNEQKNLQDQYIDYM